MRSHTIALEGSTYHGSVALLRGSEVVAERTLGGDADGPRSGQGEKLMPALAECMLEAGVKGDGIARIVCGGGPGSFTSLRVAGSVAKGLAVGYGVDLYAVPSLLLTLTAARPAFPPGEYLSVLDAMRGEFYAAAFRLEADHTATQTAATTLLAGSVLDELKAGEGAARIIGPGQRLDFHPHARGVASVLDSVVETGPVDLATWEPDYGRLAEAQVRWEAEHGRPLPR
jgi:tRNA threonylcarbamoyladenosine biosynthesis protein TsaB